LKFYSFDLFLFFKTSTISHIELDFLICKI